MFERYTGKARRVIFFARYEASQFGSPYIETEHLLLGLLREDKALTNRFLGSHESVESIRKQVEGHTTIHEKVSTSVDLPLSNECKRVLAYAAEEAERLSHKHIGTEHLLLGLLRERDCYAAHLLNERGVSLDSARTHIATKSPGIPVGYTWQQLLYNPASETIVVEMKCPADRPFPPLGRLFMRHKHADAYEQIGNPAADVSYETPVTCDKVPIVIFNSIKWNKVRGGGNPDGVYAFNLRTKALTVCVAKDTLAIPEPHLRSWVAGLVSLSDDGRTLYVKVGIEKAVPTGAVVHYYLASLELAQNKLELLSPLNFCLP